MAKRTKLSAVAGGLLLAAVAAYFGINPSDSSTQEFKTSTQSVASTTEINAAPATPHQAEKKPAPASATFPNNAFDFCYVKDLPSEAKDTIDDILRGGPFDYPDNDSRRFGNYEKELPPKNRSYYREYTVETPGLNHRGPKRIVTGGGSEQDPEKWYYTEDHYQTFCEIPDAEAPTNS
ncbi:ribonuclease domain-containing protein [Corynebacterium felinum]|uniref:Guanyl-specific ribonuclease Sa n=1 Tax=Corynebacterium felinum TaxID=131318 RepID=A0ABU2BCD3_9CORY|nr:ribonuclease domain-containing protein [Corynebacterium felinum]MDF5821187.1 ribonuclease domain-containing protein [Corynebacterium felinum]MDR7356296.1 guanyl-specific ribonuclease Sa [Corynebacterium felinum]WJY95630.1 Guanyl-specific ribonuclease Sa [Corynebacterium felinum]